jgi:hypothetical protein
MKPHRPLISCGLSSFEKQQDYTGGAENDEIEHCGGADVGNLAAHAG